jgi:type I protein arginine methyltransferase
VPLGPHNIYTHWKQTVFYLKDMLLVAQGDQITGWLSSKCNKKNPRDLDINIGYKFKGDHQEVDEEQEYFLR